MARVTWSENGGFNPGYIYQMIKEQPQNHRTQNGPLRSRVKQL